MRISVILAHPDPDSFNHAIAFNVADTLLSNSHHVAFHDLCGVSDVYRETFGVVVTSTREERETWLQRVSDVIDRYYPES